MAITMKRFFLIILLILPVSAATSDDCGKIDSCNYSSMWGNFSQFTVTYSKSKTEKGQIFNYISKDGEVFITSHDQNGEFNVFSIPGVATLWRGFGDPGIKTDQDCYAIVRDTFAIVQSYAVRALFFIGFGIKGGPEIVKGHMNIDTGSKENTKVQINPGDHMIIGGPWSLKGNVRKNGALTFEVLHEFVKDGQHKSLFLSGTWTTKPVIFPIENTQPLDKWLVCLDGKYSFEGGKRKYSPIVEDTSTLRNIGDLRAITKK